MSAKPRLFIGSTKEGLELATTLRDLLGDSIDTKVWNEGIFRLSEPTMISLVKALDNFDFAVFLFTPDDTVRIRDEEFRTVRDNIIFELGLFIGRLGLERTFFVRPDDCRDLRIPSDLLGITAATYSSIRLRDDLGTVLIGAASKIRMAILSKWEIDIQIEKSKWEKDTLIKKIADQAKGTISAESEKKYSKKTYARFTIIEERLKRLLIRNITSAKNALEFPRESELQNTSLKTLIDMQISVESNYNSEIIAMLFLNIKMLLDTPGEVDKWTQKSMDVYLSKFEQELDNWENSLK